METNKKRSQVIADCIAHLNKLADTAKAEMDAAQQQANDYGPNKDRYDSYRTKILRSRDMFAKQYSNALESVRHLQELIDTEPSAMVDYGSIVITDKQNVFISVGMGKFVSGDTVYYSISANAPIFQVLKGHSKGDTVLFNNAKYKINDIF